LGVGHPKIRMGKPRSTVSSNALRWFYVFELDRALGVEPDREAAGRFFPLRTVGALRLPEIADLADLTKLHAISMRRNSPNHLEDPFFDFVLANTWTLVTWYLNSLLRQEYIERVRAY